MNIINPAAGGLLICSALYYDTLFVSQLKVQSSILIIVKGREDSNSLVEYRYLRFHVNVIPSAINWCTTQSLFVFVFLLP